MKPRFIIALIVSIFALVACESQQHISVYVVDEITGEPVDSVFVEVKAGKNGDYTKNYDSGYTDESGHYETYMMIGCSFGCYDIQTIYKKDGYAVIKQLNNIRDTIFLAPR
jgi:5-hydroxyisourate hydrolase-like protein (transthyretin family)